MLKQSIQTQSTIFLTSFTDSIDSNSENRIAIFAKQEMLISTAKEIISDYSLNEWILIDKSFCSLEGSKEDSCKSNFFIFDRVINSD